MLFMNIDLCFFDSSMLLWFDRFFLKLADEEEAAKLYQEGEEIKRKTKVGLLGSTLIYFHKGKRKYTLLVCS